MVAVCQNHLESTGAIATEVDSLLAYAVLVRVYAEFEQMIETIIEEKRSSIENFAYRDRFDAVIREGGNGIQYGRLAERLEKFGAEYRDAFRTQSQASIENQRSITSYGNIMTHRRDVAHRDVPRLTFQEVKDFYETGHIVLDFFRETLLSIDPAQIPDSA